MTREVTCCRPEDLLTYVWSIMKERGLKHVPIVDKSARPLGVLYARDALQVLLREVEYEELLLRDYVMGVGYVDCSTRLSDPRLLRVTDAVRFRPQRHRHARAQLRSPGSAGRGQPLRPPVHVLRDDKLPQRHVPRDCPSIR